jgi:hypothetical protein
MARSTRFRFPSVSTSNLPSGVYIAQLTKITTFNARVTFEFSTPQGGLFTRSFNSALSLNSKLLEFAQAVVTPQPLHECTSVPEVLEALQGNVGRYYSVGYTVLPGKMSLGNLSAVPLPSSEKFSSVSACTGGFHANQ